MAADRRELVMTRGDYEIADFGGRPTAHRGCDRGGRSGQPRANRRSRRRVECSYLSRHSCGRDRSARGAAAAIHWTWWPIQTIYIVQIAVFALLALIFSYRPLRLWLTPAA